MLFLGRAWWLEIVRGKELSERAQNNYIEKTYIEPPRGIVYDRNGIPIVENVAYTNQKGEIRYRRKVRHPYAFSHVAGYVGQSVGKSGIEFTYDERLRGTPGERDQELNAAGDILSEGLIQKPKPGGDIRTTLDANLQEVLWSRLNQTMLERGFKGGAGIIFSLKDGAVRALVSVPSFDINAFSDGLEESEASVIFSDPRAPLFNRAIAGTFAPGSIVKPFLALAALEEGVITPERTLYSSGALTLPNPYDPARPSVFKDWKAHGTLDMRRAIAVSSNVYFYTIGGGFGDVKGLGIERIKSWMSRFGFNTKTGIDIAGEKTGFLPDPEWKKKANKQNPTWRIGDTYHASIGQGDVLVTPLEAANGLNILAHRGKRVVPRILKDSPLRTEDVLKANDDNWQVVEDGMRRVVKEGSASALQWLPFSLAAKTGTAEVGAAKDRINSWFMGYMPAEDPKLGMVVILEAGPRANNIGGVYVTSETLRWVIDHGGIDAFAN